MELPDDVLAIIRAYSKPLTRPDWRKIKRICMGSLYNEIMQNKNKKHTDILRTFVARIQRHQTFWVLQEHVIKNGFKSCSEKYGIQESILVQLPFPNLQTLRNYADKYGFKNCILKYGIQKNTLIQLLNN
jgi:hypothetical protein